MTARERTGLFIAEGSSDMPIADIVERIFFTHNAPVYLRRPDFGLLDKVPKDVGSRLKAGVALAEGVIDFAVVHRDADNAGYGARRDEILTAARPVQLSGQCIPVIPIKMTEAWLLLDEPSIRLVAGNPRGRVRLDLPKVHEVEGERDPNSCSSNACSKLPTPPDDGGSR